MLKLIKFFSISNIYKLLYRVLRDIKSGLIDIYLPLFLIPALILLIVFQLIPTIWAIWYSFTNIELLGRRLFEYSFIGFENYSDLGEDPIFWKSMSVTMEYCLYSLVIRFTIGLVAAFYITSKMRFAKYIVALLLLPYTIPGTVIPYIWLSMLDTRYGTLNRLLTLVGLPPQSWVYRRAMESVVMINCWAGYTMAMLILASALKSIPEEYYEVCEIYGASRLFKFLHVTLPLIKYPLILCIILIFKEDIDDFTYVYMFTEGGPHYRTELLSLYAYHKAFAYYELGYGCAVGVIVAIIVFLLTLAQIKLSKMA